VQKEGRDRHRREHPATLSVQDIPSGASIGSLRDLFRAHGFYLVQIRMATDEKGQNKGHALVVLPVREAEKAVAELDGCELGGRPLRVALRNAGGR